MALPSSDCNLMHEEQKEQLSPGEPLGRRWRRRGGGGRGGWTRRRGRMLEEEVEEVGEEEELE